MSLAQGVDIWEGEMDFEIGTAGTYLGRKDFEFGTTREYAGGERGV